MSGLIDEAFFLQEFYKGAFWVFEVVPWGVRGEGFDHGLEWYPLYKIELALGFRFATRLSSHCFSHSQHKSIDVHQVKWVRFFKLENWWELLKLFTLHLSYIISFPYKICESFLLLQHAFVLCFLFHMKTIAPFWWFCSIFVLFNTLDTERAHFWIYNYRSSF